VVAVSQERRTRHPADPGSGPAIQLVFWLHTAIFTGVNILLLVINMLVDHSNPWFLYCLWGWGMVLALQAGLTYRWKGLVGAQLAFTSVLLTGLSTINIHFGSGPWVVWVYVSLGIPLIAHLLYVFGGLTLLNAHILASVLWFGEIMTSQIMYDTTWWSMIVTFLTAGSSLAGLVLVHRYFRSRLPQHFPRQR